jgi:hypothetical protein
VTVTTTVATWYAIRGAGDTWWRVEVPAKAIGARVAYIPQEIGARVLSRPNEDSAFPWTLTDEGDAAYPEHEGAAVFTRPDQVRAAHALAMKFAGVPRVVAELDDNFTAVDGFDRVADGDGQRLSLRRANARELRESHLRALLCFDGLIVTTRRLADEYHKAFRELGGAQYIHVCGNHVDPDDWPPAKPESDRLRVGWMGSVSHAADVALAYAALRWAHDVGHEVVFCGHDPHWRVADEIAGAYQARSRVAGYGFEYTHMPWVAGRARADSVWPLDVAVAPLQRTEFTLGRSDSKALEYTMSGAAMVLANHEVYADWQHGETCLKANGPADYQRAVQELSRDENLRERLVTNATDYVRSERLIGQHADEWKEAVCG